MKKHADPVAEYKRVTERADRAAQELHIIAEHGHRLNLKKEAVNTIIVYLDERISQALDAIEYYDRTNKWEEVGDRHYVFGYLGAMREAKENCQEYIASLEGKH